MKIFALNLCLEFSVEGASNDYEYEQISFEELMGHFFKGPDFEGQQFYLAGSATEEFAKEIFDIQANDVWRDLEVGVNFSFPNEEKLEDFLDYFKRHFRETDAAGGLVVNEKGEYLCIYHRDRWTLPKGRVEWGEDIIEAAEREVKEETGLEEVKIQHELPKTYHTFRKGKQWVLKTTHWFRMAASRQEELTPQTDEGIEDVGWKNKDEWLSISQESYPLIRQLFESEFSKSLI